MNVPCDETTEISAILSGPIELIVDEKEPCDSENKPDLDYVHLINTRTCYL